MIAILSILFIVFVVVFLLGLFVNKEIIIKGSTIFFLIGIIYGIVVTYQFYEFRYYKEYCTEADGYCFNELGVFILVPLTVIAFAMILRLSFYLISRDQNTSKMS